MKFQVLEPVGFSSLGSHSARLAVELLPHALKPGKVKRFCSDLDPLTTARRSLLGIHMASNCQTAGEGLFEEQIFKK